MNAPAEASPPDREAEPAATAPAAAVTAAPRHAPPPLPRPEGRHPVNWRTVVKRRRQGAVSAWEGHVELIWAGGAMIVIDSNIGQGELVVLSIAIPAWGRSGTVGVEVAARAVDSIYSAQAKGFRLELRFEEFRGDGKALLKEAMGHYREAAPSAESRAAQGG